MALNAPIFLFLFLPASLVIYVIAGKRLRSLALLLTSLLFLFWSDPLYTPLLVLLVLANIFAAKQIRKYQKLPKKLQFWLVTGIGMNLLCLAGFKVVQTYWQPMLSLAVDAGIAAESLRGYFRQFIALPLGISYITFQAISYLVDLSRNRLPAPAGRMDVFNYLLMFPKAIAGPITRFSDVATDLKSTVITSKQIAAGMQRFMIGFAKKTLIADQLAQVTDRGLFLHPAAQIPTGVAWFAILCFALQIYYDFSGYTDMAIGLGMMLGFRLPENFNFPYISGSITEFWRRWHITLSGWFRDYVFYPLERKRRTTPWLNQYGNIIIVFLLTGMWHGVTLPFIAWGLLHGAAIALERGTFGALLKRTWRPLQSLYALLVLLVGWVFFRSPNLAYAWNYLKSMAGFTRVETALPFQVFPPLSPFAWIAFAVGIALCLPVLPWLRQRFGGTFSPAQKQVAKWLYMILVILLFLVGIFLQAETSYQPFIYGGF